MTNEHAIAVVRNVIISLNTTETQKILLGQPTDPASVMLYESLRIVLDLATKNNISTIIDSMVDKELNEDGL